MINDPVPLVDRTASSAECLGMFGAISKKH